MNAATAKAIKEIIAIFDNQGYAHTEVLTWRGKERMEAALIEFAEGIKQDAIEPGNR
jgi:hypothetical protein